MTMPFVLRLLRHFLLTGPNLRRTRGPFLVPPRLHPIRPWRINSGYSLVVNPLIGPTPFSNRPLAACGCAFSLIANMDNRSMTCFIHQLNRTAIHPRLPVVPTTPPTAPCHPLPSTLPMKTSLNVFDELTVRNALMFRNSHRCLPYSEHRESTPGLISRKNVASHRHVDPYHPRTR